MSLLIILFCILITTIVFIINKDKLFSPIKMFFCLWTLIITLSCIHITKLNKPSGEAYVLILIMLVSFFIGNILCLYINKKSIKKNNKTNKHKQMELYKTIFYILCIMVIIFNIIDICIVIKYRLNSVPMWKIRNWALAPFGSTNPILVRRTFVESILRNIILEPFAMLIHPVAAYYLFFDKNKKTKICMLGASILTLVTNSVAGGGGRLGYIFFIMSYGIAFWSLYKINKIDKKTLKKYKRLIIVFSILAFIAIFGFTIIRAGKGSFLKQFYKYFAMPPTLLSEWLPTIKKVPHTYGLLTTFGIHSYFFRTMGQMGLNSLVPCIFTTSFSHILAAEKFLPIGDGVGNAFVTPIYYFYIDGGYPFVIIASIFFGYIITHMFNKINKDLNIRNYVLYMLIIYGVLVSFMRIQTAIPSYVISILFAIILTHNRKEQNENEKK